MEEPLHIAVCEDLKISAEMLLDILARSPIPNQCTLFENGEALLAAYAPEKFDLLLLDIYMSGITGIQTATVIRQTDEDVPIAFVTTSADHALESYRLSASKYIEKPYKEKQILEMLQLAQMKRESLPALVVYKNGEPFRIRISNIMYLEQQDHQLEINLRGGETISIYEKLSQILPQLPEQDFFSCHKSFLVHLRFVKGIDTKLRCFQMANGKNVPIRRESMRKAKKALEAFLFRRARGLLS